MLNNPTIKRDTNFAILSLHESATKLFEVVASGQKDLVYSRAAASLIAVFHVMRELGIENPEECLRKKLVELERK